MMCKLIDLDKTCNLGMYYKKLIAYNTLYTRSWIIARARFYFLMLTVDMGMTCLNNYS